MLTIERLHAAYDSVTPEQAVRLDRAMADVAATALESELLSLDVSDAHAVCIREVRAEIELDPHQPITEVAGAWARGLAQAINACLRTGGDELVIYRREVDAVLDLITAAETSAVVHPRAWAWHQLGLIDRIRAVSGDDVVAVLVSKPDLIPAVMGSVGSTLPASIPAAGWIEIATALAATIAGSRGLLGRVRPPTATETAGNRSALDRGADAPVATEGLVGWRVLTVLQSNVLVRAWHEASGPQRDALLDLILVVAQPASLRDPATRALVGSRLDRAELRRQPSRGQRNAGDSATQPEHSSDDSDTTVAAEANADRVGESALGTEKPDDPSAPNDTGHTVGPTGEFEPAEAHGVSTSFGGVAFLVPVIERLELVEMLGPAPADTNELLARTIAGVTGVPIADPVTLAVCGLDDDGTLRDRLLAPSDPEVADYVDEAGHALNSWLHEYLEPDSGNPASHSWVWRRPARIERQPGWVEFELPIETVDPRIRRHGLDLDPGFVWWLGAVVRIRYV